jgi:translation elongation factor EF-4
MTMRPTQTNEVIRDFFDRKKSTPRGVAAALLPQEAVPIDVED